MCASNAWPASYRTTCRFCQSAKKHLQQGGCKSRDAPFQKQHMQCVTCMVRHAFEHVMHAHTDTLDMQLSQTSQTCLASSTRAEMSCMRMLTTVDPISI